MHIACYELYIHVTYLVVDRLVDRLQLLCVPQTEPALLVSYCGGLSMLGC